MPGLLQPLVNMYRWLENVVKPLIASYWSGFLDIELMDGLLALPPAELCRCTFAKGNSLAVERIGKGPVTLIKKYIGRYRISGGNQEQ